MKNKSNAYLLLPVQEMFVGGGSEFSSGLQVFLQECAFCLAQLILLGFRRSSGLAGKSNAELFPRQHQDNLPVQYLKTGDVRTLSANIKKREVSLWF